MALKRRAAAQGISAEEAHRRLLGKALGGEAEAWGKLNVLRPLPVLDGMLAATAQKQGTDLQPIAAALTAAESQIVAELLAVQGKPVDVGGYYHLDTAKADAALRPSGMLNGILAGV